MNPYSLSSLLDNIRTQLADSKKPENVYIAPGHASRQLERLTSALRIGPNTKIDTNELALKAGTSGHYDVIVDFNYASSADSVDKLRSYTTSLKPGGSLILAAPSYAGLQRIGKKPAPKHSMADIDSRLRSADLHPAFREYVGKFTSLRLMHGAKTEIKDGVLARYGRYLPNSRWYSPVMLFIYTKTRGTGSYVSQLSLRSRARRVKERSVYKVRNHKINDYIVWVGIQWKSLLRILRNASFISRYRLQRSVIDKIAATPKPASKLRVVIAMTWLEMGGVERVILNIVKDIDRSKYEVILATTHHSRNPWHSQFEEHVDEIIHIPHILGEEYMNRYESVYFREFVIRQRVDVLLITNAAAAYKALGSIKRKLPSIRVYDLLHTHGTVADNDAYLRISMPYIRHITKRVVIDEYLKIYYCEKYPVDPDSIVVLYNGIDKASLRERPDTTNGSRIIRKMPHERAIVYLGRLEVDKSPMRLVHIAAHLKRHSSNPAIANAYIAVCGDGILRHDMETEAKRLGVLDKQLRFAGYVTDTLDAVAAGDFSILTSDSEGIPMGTLESMHANTPAIVPAVGGVPEIIDNQIHGFLVDIRPLTDEKDKVAAFGNACVSALSMDANTYKSMQVAGKRRIIERFGHMGEDYMRLFDGDFDKISTTKT